MNSQTYDLLASREKGVTKAFHAALAGLLLCGTPSLLHSQSTPVVTNPSGSQNVAQSAGTTFSVVSAGGAGPSAPSGLFDVSNESSNYTAPTATFRDAVTPTYASNSDALLTVRGTGSSSGMWRGRITAGGDTVETLFGEYGGQAWLGAHNSSLNAWADIYINPDGIANAYIGKYGIVTIQNSTGNVGIGTTSPASRLEVDGNVTIYGSGAGIYFPGNTTPQTAPWTGSLYGQDYADSVDVTGERAGYDPGDVLVIDPTSPRRFQRSSTPYSTLAAGVFSTKPGVVGRRNADPSRETKEIPLAMVGIVPTKVSAENGRIQPGDLLVTSSTSGHAMKGTARELLTGAVIGKALGNLDRGTGVIDVLISLQ